MFACLPPVYSDGTAQSEQEVKTSCGMEHMRRAEPDHLLVKLTRLKW